MKTKDELQTEFETLKLKYNPLYTITAPLNEDETEFATIYLKKPDRTLHAMVGKLASGNDPLKAVERALINLYVGGDELNIILNNEDAILSCEEAVVKVFERKTAQLKKN